MRIVAIILAAIGAAGAFSLSGVQYKVDPPPGGKTGPVELGDVEFHYYSRYNPLKPIVLPHVAANWEVPGHFKPQEELIIIIHGFTGSANTTSVVSIRDAVLWARSANVILVQWENLAVGPWYDEASTNVGKVAPLLADGIRHLHKIAQEAGAPNLIQERTHIIGFSLGSQVAGLAGSHLNGEVFRITGLDPAKPIFEELGDDGRLDKTDARFVTIIHSAAGFLAFMDPLGHADFYPNGGADQPGCADSKTASLVCNHFRAYEYFVESIYEPRAFPSVKCDSWTSFEKNQCDKSGTDEVIYMGFSTPNTTRGSYYLRTNPEEPFGQGESKYVRSTTTTSTSTSTTTTTTTTEKSFTDSIEKWSKEKGGSDVTDIKDNTLTQESHTGRAGANSAHSSSILLLIVITIHRLLQR